MDILVVDSSVAVKWFIPEIYTDRARKIYSRYQNGDIGLIAPDFIHAEVGNIVWRKQIFEGMSAADAEAVIANFQAIGIDLASSADLLPSAYSLAITHKVTVYDALYVALSVREQCQMVTADARLFNAVNATLPNVVVLANWS